MLEATSLTADLARELYAALRERRTVIPLIERHGALSIDDAYRISLEFLRLRERDGERVIGKKIGVTSAAVQDMLGVHQPDFGFLTDAMHCAGDIDMERAGLIQPRAEAEIAFILKNDLVGPDICAEDVIAATEVIVPCFEVVDSRIRDWKISIIDTVADNASCGVFALGDARVGPQGIDLPALEVTVTKNGRPISTGRGSAVQGSPAQAVAWLANTLGRYGVGLNAGDIILSGSLVPLEPAAPGDHFTMELGGIGSCSIRFH